jgi:hypothetical protein
MHPEIEKLIDLALVDGHITDKERNVILNKAAEYGISSDEVEMIWEAKKTLLEKSSIEAQIKCPACGARISGLTKTCNCGYVFNTGSINETKSLEASIESLENLIIQVRGLSGKSSKEHIELLIGKVEKEIRYIKTRYADNPEVKKLLSELEIISNKYITKAVKKKKRRIIIVSIFAGFGILLFLYLFVKSRQIEMDNSTFIAKCDSLQNPKLKERVKSFKRNYLYWENFKDDFFENYPDHNDGYVRYCSIRYKFNEKTSYKIADNQLSVIQKKFKTPIDFILYDDRNNFRNLESTSKIDSTFILTLISKSRWQLKREIDEKIKIIQNTELQEDLMSLNDIDSLKQASLVFWNSDIKNFIMNTQKGNYPRMGLVEYIMQTFRTDRQTATNYCEERLNFFEKKFKMPIDFFSYRDYIYYSRTIRNPITNDKDDLENLNACEIKYKLKKNIK